MIYEPFPLKFRGSKKTHYGPRTTDRPSYRDAWTHLKIQKCSPRRNSLLALLLKGYKGGVENVGVGSDK